MRRFSPQWRHRCSRPVLHGSLQPPLFQEKQTFGRGNLQPGLGGPLPLPSRKSRTFAAGRGRPVARLLLDLPGADTAVPPG
eukprot:6599308-Alexandrium_andersonii.AAC.1